MKTLLPVALALLLGGCRIVIGDGGLALDQGDGGSQDATHPECRAPLADWCQIGSCADYAAMKASLPMGAGGQCFGAWAGTCGDGHYLKYSWHGLDVVYLYYDKAGALIYAIYVNDTNDQCDGTDVQTLYGVGPAPCTPVQTEEICPMFGGHFGDLGPDLVLAVDAIFRDLDMGPGPGELGVGLDDAGVEPDAGVGDDDGGRGPGDGGEGLDAGVGPDEGGGGPDATGMGSDDGFIVRRDLVMNPHD